MSLTVAPPLRLEEPVGYITWCRVWLECKHWHTRQCGIWSPANSSQGLLMTFNRPPRSYAFELPSYCFYHQAHETSPKSFFFFCSGWALLSVFFTRVPVLVSVKWKPSSCRATESGWLWCRRLPERPVIFLVMIFLWFRAQLNGWPRWLWFDRARSVWNPGPG